MHQRLLAKLRKDPVGTLKRALFKLVVGPWKYGRKGGYDAARYWDDRFARYGRSLRGVGDEGLSESENQAEYARAGRTFRQVCLEEPVDLSACRVLEVGPGTGFYTACLWDLGVGDYQGLDITERCFPALRETFPGYAFRPGDVTMNPCLDTYDLIVLIDVIEHIVSAEGLQRCLANLDAALVPGGRLLLAPVKKRSIRHLFYVHFWGLAQIESYLPGYRISQRRPFRDGELVVFAKPAAT